jgi:uncharacterized RDD family membrane protein YckC/cytoskeletal protein CcmA (bactofilin family)
MNSMNPTYRALIAGCLLASLTTLAPAAFAADPVKPQGNAAPTPEPALHEIGASPAAAPAASVAPAAPEAPSAPTAAPTVKAFIRNDFEDDQNNRVSIGGATYVGPKETVQGNAVAIMGPVTVDGTVNGNSVSILGSHTINGTVHGNAVVVAGIMRLGPNAKVDGNAVAAAGQVIKEPGAIVGGNTVQQAAGVDVGENSEASSWWHHGLRLGRPLAFGPHLHFLWLFNFCLIALYAVLALLFPGGIKKCGDTLAQRPGITFLTGFLVVLGLPVLFILLCVTIVGIPVALVVLPLGVLASVVFGKAAVYAFVGQAIGGKQMHPSLAVLLGSVVALVLYLIPFLGLALWMLVAFVGFSCALTALFTSSKPPQAPVPPAAAPPVVAPPAAVPPMVVPLAAVPMAAPAPGSVSALAPQEAWTAAPQPPAAEAVPPVPPVVAASAAKVSEAALPKAGFWLRMVALLIDVVLIGIFTRMTGFFLPVLAIYGATLWKLRGSTIGGIIFSLKVVRVDGQQMEWVTVVVRALACFLSMLCIGLGFIWIGFDAEKQGWHDKIAGTVVVRLPKGISLV